MTNRDSSGGVAPTAASPLGAGRGHAGTLVLELLDWLAREPRTHRETIQTWGSHCPRITPWEDAQASTSSSTTSVLGSMTSTDSMVRSPA